MSQTIWKSARMREPVARLACGRPTMSSSGTVFYNDQTLQISVEDIRVCSPFFFFFQTLSSPLILRGEVPQAADPITTEQHPARFLYVRSTPRGANGRDRLISVEKREKEKREMS